MGDVGNYYRPIAPRTLPPGGGGGGSQPPGGNGRPPDDGRMKRASTACKECQKRRTRCSGGPRCTECEAYNRECVFDELADRRRKAAARRVQEELNSLQDFVEELLEAFRVGDHGTAQHLIHTIRSGASLEELRNTVLQILRHHPNARSGDDMMNNFFDPR